MQSSVFSFYELPDLRLLEVFHNSFADCLKALFIGYIIHYTINRILVDCKREGNVSEKKGEEGDVHLCNKEWYIIILVTCLRKAGTMSRMTVAVPQCNRLQTN